MLKSFLPVVLSIATGCVAYKPLPLNRLAVDAALAAPSDNALSIQASELRNPLLARVPLDFRRGLTPDSAAILAVIVNPSLRTQRDRRSLATAQLFQAGILPNPSIDFSLDPVTGGNTVGTVTGYSGGLSWEITSLITRDAKVRAAQAQAESVQLDVAWQEWQVAQAAKKAVYDLVALQAQLTEARQVDQQLAENAALIRRAVDGRERTLLDSSAADAASQKAHADFLSAQRDARHQEMLLKQAVGLPTGDPVRLADLISLPSRLELPPDSELMEGIYRHRLDLVALRRGYDSQDQTLRAAILAQFPKISLGFHSASDTTNVHTTGVGVSVDLPIFDRNQGNIAIQDATRQQLFDEYVSRTFEARAAVAQSLDDMRSIVEQISAAETAIPSLEQLVNTYQVAVAQHNADILNYYTARNDLAQKRIDLIKLKQQLMDNKIALEIAAGRYLPEAPTTAPSSRPSTMEVR